MTKKSLGKTVLGWFVVDDGAEAPAAGHAEESAESLIAKYSKLEAAQPAESPPLEASPRAASWPTPTSSAGAGPSPAPAPSFQPQGEVPVVAGRTIELPAVYTAADITPGEQERVEKAIALLSTLPKETPKEVKKQIVEASMKAFGIPVDQIIEAGAQQIQALEGYIQHGERESQEVLSESSARIQELTQEIETLKKLMTQQVAEQQALTRTCNGEKLRVQAVLEFFGQEAVARVVKESPKLVEPE